MKSVGQGPDGPPLFQDSSCALALKPWAGSLYSAWILFSLQTAAALLGFLILCLWLPPLLKACATFLRRLFESIPPWIMLQVKALRGGPQFENGSFCRSDFGFKHFSKMVHLDMLHVQQIWSKWHTLRPFLQSISHPVFLAFGLDTSCSNWTCYISMAH